MFDSPSPCRILARLNPLKPNRGARIDWPRKLVTHPAPKSPADASPIFDLSPQQKETGRFRPAIIFHPASASIHPRRPGLSPGGQELQWPPDGFIQP